MSIIDPVLVALAVDDLVRGSRDPVESRTKAEAYVADGHCYCCGGSIIQEDDPLGRCYICWGRGHGDEVLESA